MFPSAPGDESWPALRGRPVRFLVPLLDLLNHAPDATVAIQRSSDGAERAFTAMALRHIRWEELLPIWYWCLNGRMLPDSSAHAGPNVRCGTTSSRLCKTLNPRCTVEMHPTPRASQMCPGPSRGVPGHPTPGFLGFLRPGPASGTGVGLRCEGLQHSTPGGLRYRSLTSVAPDSILARELAVGAGSIRWQESTYKSSYKGRHNSETEAGKDVSKNRGGEDVGKAEAGKDVHAKSNVHLGLQACKVTD